MRRTNRCAFISNRGKLPGAATLTSAPNRNSSRIAAATRSLSPLLSAASTSTRSDRPAHKVKPNEESPRGWRDTQVKVEGPVTARFQRLFRGSTATDRYRAP